MKFWVKVIVAFLVIIVTIFGVWAFFFREKEEVVVYNKVSEFINYKNSTNILAKLKDLQDFDYITVSQEVGEGEEKETIQEKIKIDDSTEDKKVILNYREASLSNDLVNYYDIGGTLICTYSSHIVVDSVASDMLLYILPYLKNINPKDSQVSEIKDLINEYTKDLKEVEESIRIVNDCQKSITGTNIEFEVLRGNYQKFYNKYRKIVNDSSRLIISMLNTIRYSTEDFRHDTKFAMIDAYARFLKVSTSVEPERESLFAHDLNLVLEKYNRFMAEEDIFTAEYSEYEFLAYYNFIIENYDDVYDFVVEKSNTEKKKISDGESLSDIKVDAQQGIIAILNVLGF